MGKGSKQRLEAASSIPFARYNVLDAVTGDAKETYLLVGRWSPLGGPAGTFNREDATWEKIPNAWVENNLRFVYRALFHQGSHHWWCSNFKSKEHLGYITYASETWGGPSDYAHHRVFVKRLELARSRQAESFDTAKVVRSRVPQLAINIDNIDTVHHGDELVLRAAPFSFETPISQLPLRSVVRGPIDLRHSPYRTFGKAIIDCECYYAGIRPGLEVSVANVEWFDEFNKNPLPEREWFVYSENGIERVGVDRRPRPDVSGICYLKVRPFNDEELEQITDLLLDKWGPKASPTGQEGASSNTA